MALVLENFCVLIAVSLLVCEASGCQEHQYPWEVKGSSFCCSMCPPGTILESRCIDDKAKANCKDCGHGKYSAEWNTYSQCLNCKSCLEENGVRYKKKCNSDSDAECECLPGFLSGFDDSFSSTCKRICERGNELKGDSKMCTPCQEGYFSDQLNTQCKPWTDCAAKGQYLLKNGSTMEDAECGSTIPTVRSPLSRGIASNISASTSTPATSIATVINTLRRRTTSSTAVGKTTPSRETTLLMVILLVSVLFVIVLIGKRVICFKIKNQVFHQCFGTRCGRDMPIPVQEQSEHIVSIS
ncbi:tumor necrosis factor receptor superfamily member 9 [Callorhinchus milii]|uniref:Tumor necrosis factor receptor superfamily member 9-like n=2 Tax=Callorhinchus milii TaxID=7868 RepID=A0A4W3IYZ1_CALMI|nr:tumor necrosis factor receptor superfamily member 9 [Callorhinchus milii]|eukprot:gi/632977020/ref/XP_007905116.1/ PREDICTED: tumor necrosis factor receptor superfamily member 9-like [Callorhinchus milii]